MEVITPEKLDRFRKMIHELIDDLENSNSIAVHQRISQSYYMQKAEELNLLYTQLQEARLRLENVHGRISHHYACIFVRWRDDIRWYQRFMTNSGMPEELDP